MRVSPDQRNGLRARAEAAQPWHKHGFRRSVAGSLYGDRLAALFGTVGRTADRAVLRKQLVPGGSSPKSAQADTTMAGRRFGDLERQLVDVHGEAFVTAGLQT